MLRSVFFVIRYWGGYFRPDSTVKAVTFSWGEFSWVKLRRGKLCRFWSGGAGPGASRRVAARHGESVGLRPVEFRFGTVS